MEFVAGRAKGVVLVGALTADGTVHGVGNRYFRFNTHYGKCNEPSIFRNTSQHQETRVLYHGKA